MNLFSLHLDKRKTPWKKLPRLHILCLVTLILNLAPFQLWSGGKPGYDIKIHIAGCTDTIAYLVKYRFDHKVMVNTCKVIRNGLIEFRGEKQLDKGVYLLIGDAKTSYFDFLINDD